MLKASRCIRPVSDDDAALAAAGERRRQPLNRCEPAGAAAAAAQFLLPLVEGAQPVAAGPRAQAERIVFGFV